MPNETLHPSERPVDAVSMGATFALRNLILAFQMVENGRIIAVRLDPQDALLLARNIHDAIEGGES